MKSVIGQLLFTATIVKATTLDLGGPMNSLPAQIFSDVGQAQERCSHISGFAPSSAVVANDRGTRR